MPNKSNMSNDIDKIQFIHRKCTNSKCGFIQSSHHTVAVTTNIPSQERRPSTGLIRVKTLLGQRQEWDRAAASRLKYYRGRLKSGTPPPDRRFSWIPSGTVSKVLTVWNLCTPAIQSGLGRGCDSLWSGGSGRLVMGCFRSGGVCALCISPSTIKAAVQHSFCIRYVCV